MKQRSAFDEVLFLQISYLVLWEGSSSEAYGVVVRFSRVLFDAV